MNASRSGEDLPLFWRLSFLSPFYDPLTTLDTARGKAKAKENKVALEVTLTDIWA